MKIAARIALCTILLIASAPLFAQNSGPSANGDFQFSAGGNPLSIVFDARIQNNGSTRGQITFNGTLALEDQDVDGEGFGPSSGLVNVSLTVDVDCFNVDGNQAAIGGVVEDANIPALVGNRVLLAVQDNGEGANEGPDAFTWGIYGTPDLTWVPSDAELAFDPGVGLTWLATDFERPDDVGIPSHPSTEISCETFSFAAYSLSDVAHGNGNIQVKP